MSRDIAAKKLVGSENFHEKIDGEAEKSPGTLWRPSQPFLDLK